MRNATIKAPWDKAKAKIGGGVIGGGHRVVALAGNIQDAIVLVDGFSIGALNIGALKIVPGLKPPTQLSPAGALLEPFRSWRQKWDAEFCSGCWVYQFPSSSCCGCSSATNPMIGDDDAGAVLNAQTTTVN